MRCENCGVPLEDGANQCSICGEIRKPSAKRNKNPFSDEAPERLSTPPETDPIDVIFSKKKFLLPSLAWMIVCVFLAVGFTIAAVYDSSPEFMYAAFGVGALALLPIFFLIMGRTLQLAIYTRKGLTIFFIGMVLLGGFYLLAMGIRQSDISINATGAVELFKDPFFGKIAITIIVCVTILAALIPITRTILSGWKGNQYLGHYKAESERQTGESTSEHATKIRLRELEQQYELEMKRLEIEQQKLQLESTFRREQLEYKKKNNSDNETPEV